MSVALPLLAGSALSLTGCSDEELPKLLVIGHRGASALRPEHTLASYRKAVEDGADVIEPDVVSTKDGVLVARHENEIGGTTNVSTIAKFESYKKTKTIDGVQITGWFTEDFTLAELKELRARERIPDIRPGNMQYNDQFEIPTLTEVIELAKELSDSTGRTIHITPETKHPTYFQSINLPLEDKLVETLKANDFTKNKAYVFIQSFETTNLKALRQKIGTSQEKWKLMQLIDSAEKAPYDLVAAGDTRKYGDLLTQASIKEIAKYADGVSPYKLNLINVDSAGAFQTPTDVIRFAHEEGLLVHSWTFRPENNFLPAPLKSNSTASTRNEAGSVTEIQEYLKAGLDGVFTDDPAVGRKAVDTFKP
ncbi:glycerophosphodiester phosphodiesterase [Hyalangium minutum]|uniref:glycerophosphodiester phosphodiesterase n=1 Tax=Hyalangium minutum TaxID=394096 RepID=A0A085VZM7_9BACT|nr:glycerophosphodiester phosphodiesterase [Hyalangium minutum]KFE60890.1 Glycerophosphoryl diester phosphodiesterase [Hyalangium minutum]